MKKNPPVMPPRIEWDFGQVPPDQYAVATLYEYARESEALCSSLFAWLQTPLDGTTRAKKLLQAMRAGDVEAHADIALADYKGGKLAARGIYKLFQIITVCPQFPRPFSSFGPLDWSRPKAKSDFSRVRIEPFPAVAKTIRERTKPAGMTDLDYLELEMAFDYRLQITWHRMTVKDIVKDFAKWLSKEAKNHPELKARGKRGQVNPEPLTWLSALRIHKAGISYEQARPLLAPTNYLSPNYRDKTGWSRAIKKAKKLLQDLEAGKQIVDLQFEL